ncbi:RidA family protein [Paenibacillus frigoriresistens]|uniref:RidA family protein n=1 Tax=Paenibacillus alginolyticus TaxID=59839 RepID=UPI001565FBCD|nr:RidA family protein [Paenibacillus frigoriresistens]NRF91740.1 RidA family protein [Paenibacillus frigoriresistens]
MTESIETKLNQLGIVLPESSGPAANYVNYVITGTLLFISGKWPTGKPKGKLGLDYRTEEGYQLARLAGLEVLAAAKHALGSLDRITQVVKVQGFVHADPDFDEHHLVLNGFSDLMQEVFGERGTHARSVLGASSLRDHLPLVVDTIFEIAF